MKKEDKKELIEILKECKSHIEDGYTNEAHVCLGIASLEEVIFCLERSDKDIEAMLQASEKRAEAALKRAEEIDQFLKDCPPNEKRIDEIRNLSKEPPTCNYDGEVIEFPDMHACPECLGSGRKYMNAEDGDGFICRKCAGKGQVKETQC